jgi:hypothetical protein
VIVNLDHTFLLFKPLSDDTQIQLEYSARRFAVQGWVVQTNVDTRREGFVKVTDAIGREE